MFADQMRAAVAAAPRATLPNLAAALWRAFEAGQVTEAEAQAISGLIHERKVVPAACAGPAPVGAAAAAVIKKAMGSQPKSAQSLERRRRWVASGRLPPGLAARFTLGEAAVLAVVAVEVSSRGKCCLAVGRLAAVAGVSETLVHNALRLARRLGLVTVEERRAAGWRNETNVVRIVSAEWSGWLKLGEGRSGAGTGRGGGPRGAVMRGGGLSGRRGAGGSGGLGGGCRSANPTDTEENNPVKSGERDPRRAAGTQPRTSQKASSGGG